MIDVIPLDAVPKSKWKQLWQMVDSMMYCCFNFQRLPAHKGKVTYYAEKLALTLVPSFKARYKLWKGAEKRLSRYSYGDYMQLPPPEERVYRHDAIFIDLEHSYKQYKGIHYCVDEKKA